MKFNSFESFAQYYFRLQSIKLSDYRRPTASDFTKEIPLEPPQGGSVRVMRVNLLGKPEEAFVALLWTVMFSKYCRIIHWFLLFEFLWKQKISSKTTAAIMFLLIVLRPKGQAIQWNQNCYSTHAILRKHFSLQETKEIIQLILRCLPSLPTSAKFHELVLISEGKKILKKSQSPSRIGVGYKDKGTLGKPGESYDPTEFDCSALHGRLDAWDETQRIMLQLFAKVLTKLGISP